MNLPDIYHCGFLKETAVETLERLADELADNWAKRQVFRTETEMRVSVLNDGKHPTPASKYWQAVREQAVMLDNLAVVGFDYRRNEVTLKRKLRALEEAQDDLDREDLQIDIDECYFKQAAMRQSAEDRVREINLWSQLKAECVAEDPTFNTEDVNVHQMESLYQTLRNRRDCLTAASSQAEVINVVGPLATAERIKAEKKQAAKIERQKQASLENKPVETIPANVKQFMKSGYGH